MKQNGKAQKQIRKATKLTWAEEMTPNEPHKFQLAQNLRND
jgi:hypothetical protein